MRRGNGSWYRKWMVGSVFWVALLGSGDTIGRDAIWICPSSQAVMEDIASAVEEIERAATGGGGSTYVSLIFRGQYSVEFALAEFAKTMGLIREGLSRSGVPLRGIHFEWSLDENGPGSRLGYSLGNPRCELRSVGVQVRTERRK